MFKNLTLILLFCIFGYSANLHYSFIQKDSNQSTNTLFVIGGIHGDEPGGYFAPMILSKYYEIKKGSLWIVPNLNFDSIIANKRGIYGDMNRKFNTIKEDDEDFSIVTSIKKMMLEDQVDLILNLHDGRGFYRHKDINGMFNKRAWGQATIIDQIDIPNIKFGNLHDIAERVSTETNINLNDDNYEFNVKNTNTNTMDKAMQLSLTYFAIKNNKPAFAIETSKNLPSLDLKVLYQLKTIEKYMKIMDIEFTRNFDLTEEKIQELLNVNGEINISGVANFELKDMVDSLKYFPMSESGIKYTSTNPLVAIVKEDNFYKIMNGNKFISKLIPETYQFDDSLEEVEIIIDGNKNSLKMGSTIEVNDWFKIPKIKDYRVNIIGYTNKSNETDKKISLQDMQNEYAIDQKNGKYRIEFYKEEKFCGMILVQFKTLKK